MKLNEFIKTPNRLLPIAEFTAGITQEWARAKPSTDDERDLLIALSWAVQKLACLSGDQNMAQVIQAGLDKLTTPKDASDE